MNKVILFLVILFVFPMKVIGISARSAIAMDLDNGRVFYEHDADSKHLIASITKIMTAIVVIENGDLEKEIEVGDEVKTAYGSAIYIKVGEKLTIKDLLYGLMLRSGNDAAVVLAQNVSGGMDNFVLLMNELANKLGMYNTYFYNNHGLENNKGIGNISTARDMAILTRYAMNNNTFREIFKTKEYTLKTNYNTYKWKNKNRLLHSEYYITGGKTGFTKKARRTLVTTGSKNNINVVVVTLDDGNDFQDHKSLYEEIFKNYKAVKVVDKDNLEIKNDKVYKNKMLYLNNEIYVPIKKKEKIRIDYQLYDKCSDNIAGLLKVYVNDELVREERIFYLNNKVKSSWWTKFKRWIGW